MPRARNLFASRHAPALLATLALIVAGSFSVSLGQDTNWDLLNYHRYNPWAFLSGRLDIDLAPGGAPSYINPLLDLPYAWLITHAPARFVAFAMGAWHGVAVVLLYVIGRRVLPAGARARPIAALLAIVAAADSTFLAELGNTMGDDSTAVPMLAALALALAAATGRRRLVLCCAAGVLAGIATGLKLTNAPCALGLVAAVCAGRADRPRAVAATLVGLALGFVASYGFWGWTLWQHFGNPFFPQFNALFDAPLAASGHVVERRWQPHDVVDALLFPIVFSLFPMRINEMPLVNPLWPVAYASLIALPVAWVWRRARGSVTGRADGRDAGGPGEPALVAFAAVGYVGWMTVFSVGRYAVVLELLLPLLVATTLPRLFGRRAARPLLFGLFAFAAIFPLLRFDPLGRAPFAGPSQPPYRVDVPSIAEPARTTVLIPGAPMSWMLPSFPPALAFIGVETRFPESDAYLARVRTTIDRRGGPVYALLPAEANEEGSGRWRLNRWLAHLGARRGDLACRYAIAIIANAPASDLQFASAPADACRFDRDPVRHGALMHDTAASSRALADRGYLVDVAACTAHHAWIGADPFDYRFCPVRVR